MSGEEFGEELYRENLYYEYKEMSEELQKRIDKAIEYMREVLECNYHGANITYDKLVHNTITILEGEKL